MLGAPPCSPQELFTPFKPMLAERMEKTSKIMKATKSEKFFVETKYDGERMQLHKSGREYRWWSRRGVEYTHAFGGSPSDGNPAPTHHPPPFPASKIG